jgi:hypothetical protein
MQPWSRSARASHWAGVTVRRVRPTASTMPVDAEGDDSRVAGDAFDRGGGQLHTGGGDAEPAAGAQVLLADGEEQVGAVAALARTWTISFSMQMGSGLTGMSLHGAGEERHVRGHRVVALTVSYELLQDSAFDIAGAWWRQVVTA